MSHRLGKWRVFKRLLIALLLLGCDDPDLYEFDINEITSEMCTGEGQQWYISPDFTDTEARVIWEAMESMNESLNTRVELCGVLHTEPLEGTRFIEIAGKDYAAFGSYDGGKKHIHLWPDRAKSLDHFKKVIMHEFGHAILDDGADDHLDDHNCIMAQGWHGVTELCEEEIEMINGRLK